MNRIVDHPIIEQKPERAEARFTFDGANYSGFQGEAISSALFAVGIKKFSEHVKDGAPQGIFCANGQCSQCSLIVDGILRKACVTPLRDGMDLRTVRGLPVLPSDDRPAAATSIRRLSTEILVIGGGPSGLSAAAELAERGFSVVLVDDKADLGGKLVLQTHKFFGSEEDCYAGTRGYDIAKILEKKVRAYPNVRILANSPVVGLYKDRAAGIYENYESYLLVDFQALVVAAGARERSLVFPGNDLVGVYGAGAFQTLVNRDLIRAARKVFVIGSGNVGLIGSYHALQAGIQVAGICEILPKVNGYKVHADKIVRMGVPIHLNTTVLSVEGDGKVERVTIAEVDKDWAPLLETAKTFEVDTVLVATGLSPCDEFYRQAVSFGFTAVKAGDAEEIAEASSAMFGGKIAALALAKMLGRDVSIDQAWLDKREVLKSKPGDVVCRDGVIAGPDWKPVFFCDEEIPCNPCTTVCPTHSIQLSARKGSLLDLPYFQGDNCKGCSACVAACPGLAVSLVRLAGVGMAEVQLPFEFDASGFSEGQSLGLLDRDGGFVEEGKLIKKFYKQEISHLGAHPVHVSAAAAPRAIGVRVQAEDVTKPLPRARFTYLPDEAIVCRCERPPVGQIVDFIRENDVRDVNQLKTIRVGMGACGSKTCSTLLPQVFRKAGVDPATLTSGTLRPLMLEAGMGELVNEGRAGNGDTEAAGMINSDVLIVGAGSVGVPLALYCAERGLSTIVLEKEASWGRGQNRAAIGGLRATHSDPAKIKISQESIRVVRALQEERGIDLEWRSGGYMFVAYDTEREKAFRDLLVIQKKAGLEIDWINADRVRELAPGIKPEGLLGGTYSPGDGYASPLMVNSAFHRLALMAGVDFRFGERVQSLRTKNDTVVSVKTDKDEYSAGVVVNAAGANAAEIASMADLEIPVHPDCHEAGVTEPVARFMEPMIVDIRPDHESGNYYFYQAQTGQIVFCITPKPQVWGKDTDSTSGFLPLALRRMIDLYPRLRNLKVRRTWRGMYPMTPDGLPIVGKPRELNNFMLAVGMCGQGFMLGPGLGRILSQTIADGQPAPEDAHVFEELTLYRKFEGMEMLK